MTVRTHFRASKFSYILSKRAMDKDLEVLLKFCSIFGIYIPQPRFHSRKLKVVISLYMCFLIGLVCFNSIVGISLTPLASDYIISWFVSVTVYLSQMFTHLVIMWEALAKQQEHNDFLRLLNGIEVDLKLRLRVEFGRPKIIADLRKTFVIMVVISTTGLLIFGTITIIDDVAGYFWWALIAILAMRLRSLQLIMYVELLKSYLITLNHKLNQVVCLRTEHSKQLLDIDYKDLKSLEYLENIRELYSSIYTAFYYFNEFSQTSTFVSTASSFLDFTCHIYWTLLALDNLLSISSITLAVATITPLGMQIFRLCYVCQVVKQECQRTSLMVTRLMVDTSTFTCLELRRNYRSLLYDFSLQLLHQRIEVTGKRFFNFDLECIFAICALIMTHLIILIQFTKSDGNGGVVVQDSNSTVKGYNGILNITDLTT